MRERRQQPEGKAARDVDDEGSPRKGRSGWPPADEPLDVVAADCSQEPRRPDQQAPYAASRYPVIEE